jgi:NADPH-dependent 2,4-dienoyl-CoA reductase/sulfur reductase-like enzyme
MKAAQNLSMRGHRVRLYEREKRMGGRFLLASKPPFKEVFRELTDYMALQLKKLGVQIESGKKFVTSLLEKEQPDAVIIATGPVPETMPSNSEAGVVSCEQIFSEGLNAGQRVLIIGGSSAGAEVADYLANSEVEVTVVEREEDLALDLPPVIRKHLRQRLDRKGVHVRTGTKLVSIEQRGAVVESAGAVEHLTGFDRTVLALGYRSDDTMVHEIKARVGHVVVIGGVAKPCDITDAMSDALEAAFEIEMLHFQ